MVERTQAKNQRESDILWELAKMQMRKDEDSKLKDITAANICLNRKADNDVFVRLISIFIRQL
jgi:hypothetical protein